MEEKGRKRQLLNRSLFFVRVSESIFVVAYSRLFTKEGSLNQRNKRNSNRECLPIILRIIVTNHHLQ